MLSVFLLPAEGSYARRLKLKVDDKAMSGQAEVASKTVADGVVMEGPEVSGALRLFGYDKPHNANKESVFVTSRLANDTVKSITVEIEYLTSPSETLLHTRTVVLPCVLPPGESRRLQFPSWDSTHTFYYYRTPPARTPNLTPYRVRLLPVSLTLSGRKDD